MPGQGAGNPQAYCTWVSHVHFIPLQRGDSGRPASESVSVQSSFAWSLGATWLKNIWPLLNLKLSRDSQERRWGGRGASTKRWHQIHGEAAEAELCNECEQSKEGGEGKRGGFFRVRRWRGKGRGRGWLWIVCIFRQIPGFQTLPGSTR